MIGTVLIALAGEPLTILVLMARSISDRGRQQDRSDDDAYKASPHCRAPSFLIGVMALVPAMRTPDSKAARLARVSSTQRIGCPL
jgi:hypothetical protein